MASDRPTHWLVRTSEGMQTVVAWRGSVHANGTLVFTDSAEERISAHSGKPLAPRTGNLIEAFAPGHWEHVRADKP